MPTVPVGRKGAKMEIVELGLEHEAALRAFLDEFAEAGEMTIPAFFADRTWTHAKMVETFAKQSRGEGLEEGWVPATTVFLVEEGAILGVANVRHWLTDSLLRFGGHVGYSVRPSERGRGRATWLLEAVKDYARKALSIDRLLVTCDSANVASARVIEKCGGALEDESHHEGTGRSVRRYWIALVSGQDPRGARRGHREEQGRPGSLAEFPLKP